MFDVLSDFGAVLDPLLLQLLLHSLHVVLQAIEVNLVRLDVRIVPVQLVDGHLVAIGEDLSARRDAI